MKDKFEKHLQQVCGEERAGIQNLFSKKKSYLPLNRRRIYNILNGVCYQCDECDSSFSTISDLKSHRSEHTSKIYKTNTGEWRYDCVKCGKSFKNDRALAGHIARTHKRSSLSAAASTAAVSSVAALSATESSAAVPSAAVNSAAVPSAGV